MIIVNRVGDMISGSVNGKPFSVSYDETKYNAMVDLTRKSEAVETMDELKSIIEEFEPLTKESFKELVESKSPYLYVNKSTNKYYLRWKEQTSDKAVPQVLVDRILQSVEKGIDIAPLVKCWVRFLRNPNYTDAKAKLFAEYINTPYVNTQVANGLMNEEGLSPEQATLRATTTQVAITQEGLLVCYKVSREILKRYELNENEEVVEKSRYKKSVDPDTGAVTYSEPEHVEERLFEPPIMGQRGDEFVCETKDGSKPGHFIKVGGLHYLDSWDKVDTNDRVAGVPGLHVGGLRYIQGYQNEGTVTHNIFVDPMDIGAIVGLGFGNDGAMRVRRYFVHSSFAGVNKNIYHSSKYAAITDAEYDKMVEEAVKATAEKKAALDAQQKQADNLTF